MCPPYLFQRRFMSGFTIQINLGCYHSSVVIHFFGFVFVVVFSLLVFVHNYACPFVCGCACAGACACILQFFRGLCSLPRACACACACIPQCFRGLVLSVSTARTARADGGHALRPRIDAARRRGGRGGGGAAPGVPSGHRGVSVRAAPPQHRQPCW